MEYSREELERLADMKEDRDKRAKEEKERLERLLKMPLFKRIQDPSQKEMLERVENVQRETMESILHRFHKNIPIETRKEMFIDFFTEFLQGKTKSIKDFLYKKNTDISKRQLKKRFI